MDKKRIGITLIVLGIIIIFGGAVVFITSDTNESGNNIENNQNNEQNNNENNEIDDNKDDEDEIEKESVVCLNDYQSANIKTLTANVKNNTLKIDALACMTEKEVKDNKVKFFSKEDKSFYFEIIISDENKKNYFENLKTEYTKSQSTENYNISVTDEYTTDSGRKYSVINVYKTDENKDINYKDYNMIGILDDSKIIHIRLVTTKYNLEAGFINVVEESLEIK